MPVLIGDDSEILAERLAEEVVKIDGIEFVGRAGTGAETSEAIRNLKPDVLILDMRMPGGSGIEVLKEIQREELNPLVVAFTNHGESPYRKKCLESGAGSFLGKSGGFKRLSELLWMLAPDGPTLAEMRKEPRRAGGDGSEYFPYLQFGDWLEGEGGASNEKPKLTVSKSGKGWAFCYACSGCLRGFPLPRRPAAPASYERPATNFPGARRKRPPRIHRRLPGRPDGLTQQCAIDCTHCTAPYQSNCFGGLCLDPVIALDRGSALHLTSLSPSMKRQIEATKPFMIQDSAETSFATPARPGNRLPAL
jgi:CheY-like chemotaxis protein